MAHLGFAQLQAGRAEAAIETFERARTLSGGAGGFDTSLIQAYLLARKYDQAADLARAARERRPTELRLAQLEARALSKAGRKDRAVVVMRDAVAEHADDVQAHLTLAEILQDAARADEADRVLDQAAERFPVRHQRAVSARAPCSSSARTTRVPRRRSARRWRAIPCTRPR